MKKLFLMLCIALVSTGAFAQKGVKAVGANLSYGTEISNIGIGVKGQYGITDAIRVEAGFDYFLDKDDLSMWDINANVHYLFPVAQQLTVYPLAGLTFTHWSYDNILFDDSTSKLGINLGGGVQYDIDDKWAVNFELKYQVISDFDQVVFSVGAVYKF